MRKGVILAIILAVVATPMAFAGVGFCRSMPCCPPHLAVHEASMQHPDCCTTTNCDQPPAAAGEYTTTKHLDQHTIAAGLVPVAILPTILTVATPPATWEAPPPVAPPSLQRRMAILSTLLV